MSLENPAPVEPAGNKAGPLSGLAISAGIIALGVFVFLQGREIGEQTYAKVGPQVFPYLIGSGLVIIGLLLAVDALRGRLPVVWAEAGVDGPASKSQELRQFGNVALIVAGLIASVALIAPFGFIVSSTVVFALAARAFGNRNWLLNALIGFLFSGAIFLSFTYGLGLTLPAGTLWKLF